MLLDYGSQGGDKLNGQLFLRSLSFVALGEVSKGRKEGKERKREEKEGKMGGEKRKDNEQMGRKKRRKGTKKIKAK